MSSTSFQIATSLALAIPSLVMIVGIALAIVRWQRHPAVSALLVASSAVMLLCSLAFRIAVPILIANRGGTSPAKISLLLGTIGILLALVRTVCWAAVITAVLGWRNAPDGSPPAPLQFSIRGLIVVTSAVALLCGLGRALVDLIGETAPQLVQLVDDLPVIVCLGIGIWIAAARWQRHPAVSQLAVWAFALAIALSILPQLLLLAVIDWVGYSPMFYGVFTLTASLTSATSWALAIAAALGWRSLEVPFAAGNWRVSDETSRLPVSDVRH